MFPQQNGHGVKKPRITNVKVVSIEKRKDTKNLEFLLNVSWSNGDTRTIARQYSMFFDLLGGIKMIFQDVSGVVIPDLPVPKFHVAMLFSSLAKKESRVIEEFCQKLTKLPPVISQSDILEKFFSEWGTDVVYRESKTRNSVPVSRPLPLDRRDDNMVERYRAMASYQASTSGEMQLVENDILTVIEKNQTGWWLVTNDKGQHGFAPATFLEPVDRDTHSDAEEWVNYDGESRIWIAVQSYTAQSTDEVSYKKGDEMEVIATSNIGWWKVRCHGKVAVTPASNLIPKPTQNDSVFDNPVYDDGPIRRRASFTGMGTIYASIRNPPPRRDSSKKKIPLPNEPVKDATLAYASVYVTKDEFLSSRPQNDVQETSNEEEDIYSKIIPKHLRSPRSPKHRKNKIDDIYEEVHDEGPPPIPVCFVDETATLARRKDEEAENQPQRRKSADELNSTNTKTHGYLNVVQADEAQKGTNLYRAVTEYQVPMDRHDDLPLPAGCIVRALTKDGTFFFVSTLDEPPKQGWVPEDILENVHAKTNSGHRRSRSLGDILAEPLQSQPDVSVTINIQELHHRTPVVAPRQDRTRRYFSFDATANSKDDHHVDTQNVYRGDQEMASEIQSLKISTLKETETWFHGKMNRQSCEEHMLRVSCHEITHVTLHALEQVRQGKNIIYFQIPIPGVEPGPPG
ncbi:uncharacterized protein LOC110247564 [Exaiptasia diaphana]|uniref:SH3 domain-containing protein n=1 Tax=Exaiptasia diaphana TaxID=2652724 RepID=A0A913XSS5_EXADI|nr:uncharacterized protein LOC110247564 [Exaiptasia diaphana]